MKNLTKLFILLLLTIMACDKPDPLPTKGNIAGVVKEEGSNVPIGGATVSIAGFEETMTTEDDGSYKTSDLYARDYSITIEKLGYVSKTSKFTVEPDKITQGDFFLKEDLPSTTTLLINLTNTKLQHAIELENTRSGTMEFVAETSKPWLKVSPGSGSIASFNKRIITVTADLEGVEFGDYQEKLLINVGQASLSIPIYVTYTEPTFIRFKNALLGDTINVDDILSIQWESNIEGKVKIELIKNNLVLRTVVPQAINSKGGTFAWTLPIINADQYQLRISSIEYPNIFSISDLFYIDKGPETPTIITKEVVKIDANSFTISAEVTKLGTKEKYISDYGFVYSEYNQKPTLQDVVVSNGNTKTTVLFEKEIKDLKEGQRYYIRAYAVNSVGTAFGEALTITTNSSAPIVVTSDISSITQTTAIAGGNVTSDGGLPITQRGVCFSTVSPASLDSRIVTDANNLKGEYSAVLNNLQKGTKYYVRAYAINSSGLSYGEEKSFTTEGGVPHVSSISVTLTSDLEIEGTGIVESDGGNSITAYGYCWNDIGEPSLSHSSIKVGNNIIGKYEAAISDLKPNTAYFLRAYATNSKGTAYGNVLTLTTKDGLPEVRTQGAEVSGANAAELVGEIVSKLGINTIEYGFCWSKYENPTLTNSFYKVGVEHTGTFSHTITGLEAGRQYYFKAYAKSASGITYGEQMSLYTEASISQVQTNTAIETSASTAHLSGEIISTGGIQLTAYGFCWSRSTQPTISDHKIVLGSGITGSFAADISNLSPETKYFVRAFSTNSKGTSYGRELSITTLKDAVRPQVNTISAFAASATEAEFSAMLINDGGAPLLSHGFCWSTTPAPTINEDKIILGTSVEGGFFATATKLSPFTTYYVRAFATNEKGTAYGEDLTFNTPIDERVNFSSPYLNEISITGKTLTIRWKNVISDRRIILITNDGIKDHEIANNLMISHEEYEWKIPLSFKIGTNNKFKILDYTTLELISESPTFEIKGLLEINDLSSNTQLLQSLNMNWTINYQTTLKFDLYQSSAFVKTIATNVNSLDGKLIINLEALGISDEGSYRVKITDENDAYISKVSKSYELIHNIFVDGRDNQSYNLVQINDQIWFVENLEYGGGTYKYNTIDGVCPDGWKIPSKIEWEKLFFYLGNNGYNYDGSFGIEGNSFSFGNKLGKALGSKNEWRIYDNRPESYISSEEHKEYRNKSGFNAIPTDTYKTMASWYTSTKVSSPLYYCVRLNVNGEVSIFDGGSAASYSIRCIRKE